MRLRVNSDSIVTCPWSRILTEFVIAFNVNDCVLVSRRVREVTGIFVIIKLIMVIGSECVAVYSLANVKTFWPNVMLRGSVLELLTKDISSFDGYLYGRMLSLTVIILANIVRLSQQIV